MPNEFTTDDGMIEVRMKGSPVGVYFVIRDGNNVLAENKDIDVAIPRPWYVYWADIDNNGLKDFIVISEYMGNGLDAHNQRVDIYLKKPDDSYVHIRYDTMSTGMEDFVDVDNDGKYEIIITGVCGGEHKGRPHNYFFYNIYAAENYRLVNADDRVQGFPKFIWITNNPNDKDTTHLTQEERQDYTDGKNASIQYPTFYGRVEEESDRL